MSCLLQLCAFLHSSTAKIHVTQVGALAVCQPQEVPPLCSGADSSSLAGKGLWSVTSPLVVEESW